MQFNPDPNKQANKVIFSRKSKVSSYALFIFNNNDVKECLHQKHIAQLLSTIHEIQTAFDNNPTVDVRDVFLDISKTFDKVGHIGLLFKLQTYGVVGELLSLLENYLENF